MKLWKSPFGRVRAGSLVGWFLIGAVAIAAAKDRPVVHTIDGNPAIKTKNLRGFYAEKTWRTLKDFPYDAYVILRGTVRDDRTIKIRMVEESYPNQLRIAMAKELTATIRVTANSAGGRVRSGARVYVVFYETGRLPCEAIVFAESMGMAAPGGTVGGDFFLTTVTYWPDSVPTEVAPAEVEIGTVEGEGVERSAPPRRARRR